MPCCTRERNVETPPLYTRVGPEQDTELQITLDSEQAGGGWGGGDGGKAFPRAEQ